MKVTIQVISLSVDRLKEYVEIIFVNLRVNTFFTKVRNIQLGKYWVYLYWIITGM
ncbi:MAG: hypothetical protein ACLFQS_06735 [Bacteroidales bacterium]